jgi:hypothetical protein
MPCAHEHQDIAGGNQSDDGLSDQLGTQRLSTIELPFLPLLQIVSFFALQVPLRLCCKWSVQNNIFLFCTTRGQPYHQ